MNRLTGIVIAAALLGAACSDGTGTPTINPQVSAAVGSARQQLCDPTNHASLAALSTQLANVDANADTTVLRTNLGKAASNLNALSVSGDEATLKDAAATAIKSVQAGLSNPATLKLTAVQAASALTALSAAIC